MTDFIALCLAQTDLETIVVSSALNFIEQYQVYLICLAQNG